ncbi:mechanosensitive ion channel protein MscS [Arenicella chitinivorans]|uniref:Small-conductance mechanosensitive channel n=1 Tax=Arenicella chitinivorans TaxID=1329800 RepID=A0A918S0B3_9GAMM|nr:mechanosensitive ion channel family protein [Arenicella chitinivorans]GHA17501.1 mechanosensitive ion channel protein MscS [Arenicella chitinivorans]
MVVTIAPSTYALQAEPEPVIEVSDNKPQDSRIEARIESIFDKVNGLEALDVTVEAGVVTLTGDVANEAAASDALDIAQRTAGVVRVDDTINRTLDVADNVRPMLADLQQKARNLVRATPLVLVALGVFIVFAVLASLIARWSTLWQRLTPNPFLAEIASQAVRILIIGLGLVVALNLVGASRFVTTILGGAGVLGIAIGFAVRDTLENYISSIMLSIRQPFRARDHVVINDLEGYVIRLTSRATILMTLDGNHLRIPNSVVFKGIILNYTTNSERRFEFELGIDGEDDPLEAMQVGLDAINQQSFVLCEPSAGAMLKEVGDSNLVIKFTAWVDQSTTNFAKARSVAIVAAKSALEVSGFTLPEPIYRLRFDHGDAALLPESAAHAEVSTVEDSATLDAGNSDNAAPSIQGADVSIDQKMVQKVEEERVREDQSDLLNSASPQE